jgi:YEATS family
MARSSLNLLMLLLINASLWATDHDLSIASVVIGTKPWQWTVFLSGTSEALAHVKCVQYKLEPSFPNPSRTVCSRGAEDHPFSSSGTTWGAFNLSALVTFDDRKQQEFAYTMDPQQEHQKDLRASADTAARIINAVRPAVFGNLSGTEARVYKEIIFRVSDQPAPSRASSILEDGTRVVEINEGYARAIEMLAEAMLVEQAQNRPVLIPYIRYFVRSRNQHASFIKDPAVFAHFDFDEFLDRPDGALAWNKMISNSVAFVVAHEVGHHVLGHIDKPLPTDPDKLRQMELDADAWAMERLDKASPHFSPLSSLLPVIFDYYVAPNPIEHETHSVHPADLQRIHAMFEAVDLDLPDFRADIEKEGIPYQEFRRFVKDSLKDYDRQIVTDSAPVQELK